MKKIYKKDSSNNKTNLEKMIYILEAILKYYNNDNISKTKSKKHNDSEIESKKHNDFKMENKKHVDENVKGCEKHLIKKAVSIPIVIAEKYIDIPIQYKVNIDYWAYEINNIKNDIYLENSIILPIKIDDKNICNVGKVFISGFIKNRIEYSTVKNMKSHTFSGEVKYITSYLPFKCTTYANFERALKINSDNQFIKPIKCSIKSANIFGTTIRYDNEKDETLDNMFRSFQEKMILRLHLTFIQENVVNIYDVS